MGGICGGPRPQEEQEENENKKDEPLPTMDAIVTSDKTGEEEKGQSEEEKRQAEEDVKRRKEEQDRQLQEKFDCLVKEFLTRLDADYNGYISREELKEVYPDKADQLMVLADKDKDNHLNLDEIKRLFYTDKKPNCEMVMQVMDDLDKVQEHRAKKAAEAEAQRLLSEFEDACNTFIIKFQSTLGNKVTSEELKLVYDQPTEKYGAVFEAEAVTLEVVKSAFTTEDGSYETTVVVALTEAFNQVAVIRDSEAKFDVALKEFFAELKQTEENAGLTLSELKPYFGGDLVNVMKALDANNDGQIDESEMKPMFKREDHTYDISRLESLKAGFGDALIEKHKADVAKAEAEFDKVLVEFQQVLSTQLDSSISADELREILPEKADTYVTFLNIDAGAPESSTIKAAFVDGEKFDKEGLTVLQSAVLQIIDFRVKQFNERLNSFSQLLLPSWLKSLKLDELSAACPEHEADYAEIAACEKPGALSTERLQEMFVPGGKIDYKGFETIYNALDAIQAKALKKFNKAVKLLKAFVGKYCTKEALTGANITRQEVFQVYIDETRVADFNKKWVKATLNLDSMDNFPDDATLQKLFTNKKTQEPDPKLVSGFKRALEKVTDVRRLSHSQNMIALDMAFEKVLRDLVVEICDYFPEYENRHKVLENIQSSYPEETNAILKMLEDEHDGRLKMEALKPIFMGAKEQGDEAKVKAYIELLVHEREEHPELSSPKASSDVEQETSLGGTHLPADTDSEVEANTNAEEEVQAKAEPEVEKRGPEESEVVEEEAPEKRAPAPVTESEKRSPAAEEPDEPAQEEPEEPASEEPAPVEAEPESDDMFAEPEAVEEPAALEEPAPATEEAAPVEAAAQPAAKEEEVKAADAEKPVEKEPAKVIADTTEETAVHE